MELLKELSKDGQFQALSHQVIHIFPKELHHNDEQTDHEGAQQHRNEVLQNIYVKFFDETHLLLSVKNNPFPAASHTTAY